METFKIVIEQVITEYANALSIKFNLNYDDVLGVWNNKSDLKISGVKKTKSNDISRKTSQNNNIKKCIYVYKKGNKENQICNTKACEGSDFCKKHNKVNVQPKVEKKKIVKSETIVEKKEPEVVNNTNNNVQKYSIKKNEYGNFEHQESHLVFDRATKEAYGKQVGDKIVELTKEDIETCNKFNFKYRLPKSLESSIEEDNNEEEDDDDIEEDNEGEVEEDDE